MHCQDCPRYDHESRKCHDGKLNPQRYGDAVETCNVYGVRAICTFNDHRQRLIEVRSSSATPSVKQRAQ